MKAGKQLNFQDQLNIMRKTRLYLDTSVISMIDAPLAPEKEKMTKEFFRIVSERNEEYEIYISPVGLAEMTKSPQEKRIIFATLLNDVEYTNILESDEVDDLADEYAKAGFLTSNHMEDLKHIAYAVIAQCDYIVSWNMRHIVREKTISGVRAVNVYNKYDTPFIVTPEIFIEKSQP